MFNTFGHDWEIVVRASSSPVQAHEICMFGSKQGNGDVA